MAARKLRDMTGATVLLKGPGSIVAGFDREGVNCSGNALLATGGSGDILTGIIASLLLRIGNSFEAAACGAWLHGRGAELQAEEGNHDRMRATELISHLRKALLM